MIAWLLVAALAIPVNLPAGETAPHPGVLLDADDVQALARMRAKLGQVERDLAACKAEPCAPRVVTVDRPVESASSRWPVVVALAVGLVAGGASVWMVMR